jgi:hypothetical protein
LCWLRIKCKGTSETRVSYGLSAKVVRRWVLALYDVRKGGERDEEFRKATLARASRSCQPAKRKV